MVPEVRFHKACGEGKKKKKGIKEMKVIALDLVLRSLKLSDTHPIFL